MKNKKVLIGVTGGIAAYKTCSLVNMFSKEGADVKVIMTHGATKFVTPLTFQSLTNHPVYLDMWQTYNKEEVEHISLAKWADIVVISPATANIIGKIAHGIADNMLTTVVMALPKETPVLIVPAMNTNMWENPIVQKNVKILSEDKKYKFINPRKGILACRDEGYGKIVDNEVIIEEVQKILKK
ncbi:MAG: Phosphopantothenoylcysteine decarboxylase, Phosphopantothenate-cysteine ligase [Berkelbacteria bacterium GW2011_GWA1_36_9]|uniref:Phosphopantothenoylcysteine decarboxylase, Phosphopantothenate-cysteine ligase n=1 Tax=Berkelbacteria bacterium GW2011_GWA1_36_9 TaxID=1618331 RepID=A0A0G0IP63_9BACT|nr:MAG: Phosphopantothenoylcysteine decarboxylase, Phosphopantothenate-cysteine ligase [Berkelbacteria bacterium GW2011_GWA1_36_9]